MNNTFARTAKIFAICFALLFLFRLIYGYVAYPNGEPLNERRAYYNTGLSQGYDQSYDFAISRKNYAGQKKVKASSVPSGPIPGAVDQRYEKVATLGMNSSKFDEDEAQIRTIAKGAEALIQHEQAFGLKGHRQLQLALGVPPASFDEVLDQIKQVGKAVSFQVNKTDKTNEYRALLAKQESLEKSRDNLLALKNRDAELDDLIALEERILGLEEQIQSLGVSVGEFDSEYEFVTIKLTMKEIAAPKLRDVGFMARVYTSFSWALKSMLGLSLAFLMLMGGLWIVTMAFRATPKLPGEQ